jgi:hypothetical protein
MFAKVFWETGDEADGVQKYLRPSENKADYATNPKDNSDTHVHVLLYTSIQDLYEFYTERCAENLEAALAAEASGSSSSCGEGEVGCETHNTFECSHCKVRFATKAHAQMHQKQAQPC